MFVGVIVMLFIGGLIVSWPRPITQKYNSPNMRISIVKGDLLDEKTNLVIGTVDTFDTELPVIIASGRL